MSYINHQNVQGVHSKTWKTRTLVMGIHSIIEDIIWPIDGKKRGRMESKKNQYVSLL